MQLPARLILAQSFARAGAVVALLAGVGCTVDVPGFTGAANGTDGTGAGGTAATTAGTGGADDGADETEAYDPDPAVCAAPSCTTPADCCEGVQPTLTGGLLADDAECPSAVYPNNWDCVGGECVHGGCSSGCVAPFLECMDINSVGFCVRPCNTTTNPCPDLDGNGFPDMECTGVADDNSTFCEQSLT